LLHTKWSILTYMGSNTPERILVKFCVRWCSVRLVFMVGSNFRFSLWLCNVVLTTLPAMPWAYDWHHELWSWLTLNPPSLRSLKFDIKYGDIYDWFSGTTAIEYRLTPWPLTLAVPDRQRSRSHESYFKYLEYGDFSHKVSIANMQSVQFFTGLNFGFIALGRHTFHRTYFLLFTNSICAPQFYFSRHQDSNPRPLAYCPVTLTTWLIPIP